MTSKKDSIDNLYAENYAKIMNTGAVGLVSDFSHRTLERKLQTKTYPVVLELGAGSGQHFPFVKHGFETYFETDLRVENIPLRNSSDTRVQRLSVNAENLQQFEDNSIDRIIATCLLIHLPNPEKALQEWQRVLRPGGLISIYVPCEPGLMLRLIRSFTTVRKASKHGLKHSSYHYREHKYSYPHLRVLLDENFANCRIKFSEYPFPKLGWDLNLWNVVQVEKLEASKTGPGK